MDNESVELSSEEIAVLVNAYGGELLTDEQLEEVSGGAIEAKTAGPTRTHSLTCSVCGTQFSITLPTNSIPPSMCHDCSWRYIKTHFKL